MSKKEFVNAKIQDTKKGLIYKGNILMYRDEELPIKEGARQICKKVKPKSVLEIGFGYGWTADVFQDYGVLTHIIIEANKGIWKKGIEWAKQRAKNMKVLPKSRLELICGYWQDIDDITDEFDLIYYDPYELFENPVNHLAKFKAKWEAWAYSEQENAFSFPYKLEGKTYYQHLRNLENKIHA